MNETTVKRLAKEGWTRQFTASEPRLSEAARLYRQLGFEVRLEPVEPTELPSSECSNCYLVRSERHRTIYTRLRGRG
jgi:hypothetical protein